MSVFKCPICGGKIRELKTKLLCAKNHCFDKSTQGYTNLLPVNKKNSKIPGDSKEMVDGRRSFLEQGFYQCFSDKINILVQEKLDPQKKTTILDVGCGEGYYTGRLNDELKDNEYETEIVAFDISKFAVKEASKKYKDIKFVVASCYDIPIKDSSIDLVLNVFAPMPEKELARVIKKGGTLIYAVPSPTHLLGLKTILYETPYLNEEYNKEYKGFKLEKRVSVTDEIEITDKETIKNLFSMTPYFFTTPKQGAENLEKTQTLKTQIGFDLLIYKKK